MKPEVDVCVIGAGAAGLMAAATAAARGRRVLVLDSSNRAGKKILMSGGGRCNFTNIGVTAENYLSQNPHFAKSALSRYTQWDFIAMVERHGIPYHEKTLGQLFCDRSSKDILNMLLEECAAVGVSVQTDARIERVSRASARTDAPVGASPAFWVRTGATEIGCGSLIVATGGLSIPKMGASGFGYALARQFGLRVLPTRAGLVPFVFAGAWHEFCERLAGLALPVVMSNVPSAADDAHRRGVSTPSEATFSEAMLFSHRGLTGPAALQISSYWQPGEAIAVDLLPGRALSRLLFACKQSEPTRTVRRVLNDWLPKKLVAALLDLLAPAKRERGLAEWSITEIETFAGRLHRFLLEPAETEGYRTAEVTLGGVDTAELSSRTMMAQSVPGLFFIGEVVDVTGHLGGYNFQWAWASGVAAGEAA